MRGGFGLAIGFKSMGRGTEYKQKKTALCQEDWVFLL